MKNGSRKVVEHAAVITEAVEEYSKKRLDLDRRNASDAEKREQLLANVYRVIGRIETADLFGKLATVASLKWLDEVKESKVYLEIPGIGTWESFCNLLGKSRRQVDEQLQNLGAFGSEFLATVASFSLGYRELRKLRKAITDGDLVVDAEAVVLGEERIPFTPDHAEDLQAAIEALLEEKDKQIKEAEAIGKAKDRVLAEKDRVLAEKERVMLNQEKKIEALTKKLKRRELSPEEEVFLKEVAGLEVTFEGLLLSLDPANVPEDATPVMRSAMMSLLFKMKAAAQAHFDTASEVLGIDTDEEWVPPYERDAVATLTDGEFQGRLPLEPGK